MACSRPCEFVRWRVDTIRFTQSNTRYMENQLQGGSWVEVEIPPPGPTPELPIPSVLQAVKENLRITHGLTDSDGHCDPNGQVACRCVRVSKYEPVLKWSVPGGFPTYIPPVGGMTFWSCRIDFEAIITKYRARGECVPASFTGRQVEIPEDSD